MHILKKPSQKSQNSKFVYFPFINKIEQKSESFQQKTFLLMGQGKKKYNEKEDTSKDTVGVGSQ